MRDQGKQFRGRLGGRVSLWTARHSGLTVSSVFAVDGPQWRLVAALNPDADFTDELRESGCAVVSLLERDQLRLAEAFSGGPAPGGSFKIGQWVSEEWGDRPLGSHTWAGVRLESLTELGYSLLATCLVVHLEIGDDPQPLSHYRGNYH